MFFSRSDKNELTIRVEDLFGEVKAAPLSEMEVSINVSVSLQPGGKYFF